MASNIHPSAKIHYTAVIGANVDIGANVEIGPYCVIGLPGEHREAWGTDMGVIIDDNCVLTGLVTVDAGIEAATRIGQGAFIMKHAHVGHDAVIGNQVTIACGAKIAGHVRIDDHANIGLNAVIHQRHHIPTWAMIGMGAVVPLKLKVLQGRTYAGNPATLLGINKKAPESIAYASNYAGQASHHQIQTEK